MSDQSSPLVPASLLPPGVKDDRQAAFLRVFGQALEEINLAALVDVDPMTVDARLLPYLIREFAAQEFIAPEWPEHVQRRILKNIWALKSLHGFDAGVKLGLSLLGMTAHIEHWHQVDPKGAPNTHVITVEVDEALYPDDGGHLSPKQVSSIWRMIDNTKRFSQETELKLAVSARGKSFCGAYVGTSLLAVAPAEVPPPPQINVHSRRAVVPTVQLSATARPQ